MIEILEKTDIIELFKEKSLDGIVNLVNSEWECNSSYSKRIVSEFPEVLGYCKDGANRGAGLGYTNYLDTKNGQIFNLSFERTISFGRRINYEALYSCLEELKIYLKPNYRIAIPYGLNCKFNGGSWKIVFSMLSELFEESDLRLIICKKD